MLTITKQEKGRVLINNQPYVSSQVRVIYNDDEKAIELYDRRNDDEPLMDPITTHYSKVMNPNTNTGYESYEEMKSMVNDTFFSSNAGTASTPMMVCNDEGHPIYVRTVNSVDLSHLNLEDTQALIKDLLSQVLTVLNTVKNVLQGGIEVSNDSGAALPVSGSVLVNNVLHAIIDSLPNVNIASMPNVNIGNVIHAIIDSSANINIGSMPNVTIGNVVHAIIDSLPSITVANFPASQPITAAALPLPANAATSTRQDTQSDILNNILAKFALDADGGLKVHLQNPTATQPISGTVTANVNGSTTPADSLAATAGVPGTSFGQMFNGASWDRQRNNYSIVAKASGSENTAGATAALTNYNAPGALVVVNITALTGTLPILTVRLQMQDIASGNWIDVGVSSGNIGLIGINLININPRTNYALPRTFRFAWTVAGTLSPSFTFSIGVHFTY